MKINLIYNLVFIAFMTILCFGCNSHSTPESETGFDQAYGNPTIMRGMNLGNALESPLPWEWGVTIQPEYFDVIKDAGFDTVRIPVRFSSHTTPAAPFIVDTEFMLLVDQIVNQGLTVGLTVILDFHHYDELMADTPRQRERFLAIWEYLADHYQNYPAALYFEILNEPSRNLDASTWNELANDCIHIIRQSNPNRPILIGGIDYNSIDSLELLSLPSDKNLMAVFHFYDPFEFTHQSAAWVDGSDAWLNTTWNASNAEKQAISEQLDQAAAWSENNQIPLVMTEFGSIAGGDASSRQRWTQFMVQEAKKHNIGWVYWDFCAEFRVYDCEQGLWDEILLGTFIN